MASSILTPHRLYKASGTPETRDHHPNE